MNNDVDVGVETSLAASFPLPFRVLTLIGLGILSWATNLHALHSLSIDAAGVLDLGAVRLSSPLPTSGYSTKDRSRDQSALYLPTYRVFGWYACWCFSAWALYRMATHGDTALADMFKYIPAVAILGMLGAVVAPFEALQKPQRDAFLLSLGRCLLPAPDRPTFFSDVVFADVLTSFAKVIGDIWLSFCMLLPAGSLLRMPVQDGIQWLILPTLLSIPYIVRLRQCLIDYKAPGNNSRRPLYNAIKYATAFPVIFLSAAQRIVVSELAAEKGDAIIAEPWHGEHRLFRLWLLSAAVNSLYSFWWDVTNDWGLDMLAFGTATKQQRRTSLPRSLVLPALHAQSPVSTAPSSFSTPERNGRSSHYDASSYPWGLRPTLLYPLPTYPFVVFFNLILRLTWSAKLSSHLHSSSEGSVVIFWVEVAEIVRRWVWVFVRIEWEVIKVGRGEVNGRRTEGAPSPSSEDYELIGTREQE